MKKERKDKDFIHKPVFPGGASGIRKFINDNMRFPAAAAEAKIEGVVRVNFTIDYQGKVVDAKVATGLGYGCDEEALRLVKLMEFEVARHRGLRILFHKHINIRFKLNKQRAQRQSAVPGQLQYILTPASPVVEKKAPPPAKPSPTPYIYTIKLA